MSSDKIIYIYILVQNIKVLKDRNIIVETSYINRCKIIVYEMIDQRLFHIDIYNYDKYGNTSIIW